MIKNYFKIAWRTIRSNKVFSAVNIIGLAISMAACIVISLYVWNELNYDSFHHNKATIYRITEKQNQAGTWYNTATTPGPLAPALQKDFAEIAGAVRFSKWSGLLKNGTNAFEEGNILLTENSIFTVFDFTVLKGNKSTALLAPDEIVITESTAIKYFGKSWQQNPALIGQPFLLNNTTSFKLAAVVKDPPHNSSIEFNILLPVAYLFTTDEWSYKWGSNSYHTYLLMKPGTNMIAFEKKLSKKLYAYNGKSEDLLQLQPLSKQYLYSKFDFATDWGRRSDIKYVKIFSGVGLLLLIIACVNFINLSTARSLRRSMEVGVRKVNGASRNQLVLQFLSESVLMSTIAGLVALTLIKLLQPLLVLLTGRFLFENISLGISLTLFLLFVVVIGVLSGLYPALALSAFNPVKVFKGGIAGSRKPFWKALVVLQFAVSVTLIVCTIFMFRQLRYTQNKDLGFNKEQLINVRLKGQLRQKALLFKQELDKQTSIAATAPATMSLVNVDNSADMEWDGMQPGDKFLITQANVNPDFIPALGMQLMNGNNFTPQSEKDTFNNYIVNEMAVKRMGYTVSNVIGKKVTFWGAKGTIIGVVKDFHFKPLSAGIEPFIFRYQPWSPYFSLFVKTAPGKTADAVKQIELAFKKYEKDYPPEFSFVNEALDKIYLDDRRIAGVVLLFSLLTIFVGCLGLFGLTVFAAEQRIKETGIRKVLGASVASLAALLSKDFLKLVLVAVIIAVPAAWYISNQWLQNYAYRINIDYWVFAMAGMLVVAIALLTTGIQAIKAAMANPVKSLRTE